MQYQARIGIDARFWGRQHGGFSSYTQGLLRALAEIDRTTMYKVFLRSEDIASFDITQDNFQPVAADFVHYTAREQTGFLRLLQREQLDLVHFLNFNHPLLYRGPFVTTLHDLTVLHQPVGRSQRSFVRRQAFLASLRHALYGAKRIIAISEFSAKDAEKRLRLAPTKIEVVYEGLPEAVELPFGNRAIIQKYLGTRDPYFLFVSQWRPHKGILTLLRAFEAFKAETGLPHRLVLAGRQTLVAQAVSEALEASPVAEDIIAPGFVPDELLPSLYHNAAAFIMPSEYEGFGLPVLEALRYGAPTIVANNSSLPEIGGKAVLYFETGNAVELSAQLQRLVSDTSLYVQLQENLNFQLAQFSWEACASQTLSVYRHVLEKQGTSATV